MTRSLALILVFLLALSGKSGEARRRNLSGTWVMNSGKSRLQIQPPDSSVLHIEHREPTFELRRTHRVKGVADMFRITLTTDGREVVAAHSGRVIHSRCYWQGERLVFDSRVDTNEGEATNVVFYSLAADGRELTAEEHFRGPTLSYDNLWVFDLQ
jgi:hypothetical protein